MEELNEALYNKILNFDETKKKEWIAQRKPYAVLFELTPKCNFNCVHCYLQNCHTGKILSTEQIKFLLDILYDEGIVFLTLTGGEILTRKDFCELYLYAKKKGFFVELFTNGYLINDEMIEIFKEYPPLLVSISLYGSNDDTYLKVTGIKDGFTKVYDNCRKLVEAGVRVSLKSPIMSITEGEMPQMVELAKKIGLEIVFSFEIHNAIDGSDVPVQFRTKLSSALGYEFNDYLNKEIKADIEKIDRKTYELQTDPCVYTCNVATNSFIIDYMGNMLPCMKLRHYGISLLDNRFADIWDKFKIYKEYKATKENICKKCDSVYFCDVCPAESDFIYGDKEYRDCKNCKAAKIRKQFYLGQISYEEAIKMADI